MWYGTLVPKPPRFAAQLLWLDPKQQRKPILKFDCFQPDGFPGLIGDHVLIVFPDGLKGKAIIQSFEYGSWHASDSLGRSITFDNVDEHGLLELRSTLYPNGENPPQAIIMRWNGESFESVQAIGESSSGR